MGSIFYKNILNQGFVFRLNPILGVLCCKSNKIWKSGYIFGTKSLGIVTAFPKKDPWKWVRVSRLGQHIPLQTIQRLSREGPRGSGREWATLGVHPLSWLLSNNWLEEVCGTLTKGTFSSRLLLSNQDKGCTPSVAHSLPLPLPPGVCSTCQISEYPRTLHKKWVQYTHRFSLIKVSFWNQIDFRIPFFFSINLIETNNSHWEQNQL